MKAHFDTCLSLLAGVIKASLGEEVLKDGVVLRDASGQVAFFSSNPLNPELLLVVSRELKESLGPFARQDRVISDPSSPGAKSVLECPGIRDVQLEEDSNLGFVRLLDRQIVGSDWLQKPLSQPIITPRFVFASLKGGVGRSTALSVIASDQSRKGRNVLVVDLDLEAPGVGSMLLASDRRPLLGGLDFLVESGLKHVPDEELESFIGTSGLTAGAGLVDVLPVVGTMTMRQPFHFIPKLSRAMVEGISLEGDALALNKKVKQMVDRFAGRREYDLVLIDVRAGMAELTAGSLLGLGAKVLLFGTAQDQTVEGYRYLFSHLTTLRTGTQNPSPWQNFQMIHAKASLSDDIHQKFKDELWELFTDYLYDEQESDSFDSFNFDVNDPEAPHNPIPILNDSNFVDWDPVKEPTLLTISSHQATFGRLIRLIDDAILPLNAAL
jgi:Mrp family chromosome partitioning ATPase